MMISLIVKNWSPLNHISLPHQYITCASVLFSSPAERYSDIYGVCNRANVSQNSKLHTIFIRLVLHGVYWTSPIWRTHCRTIVTSLLHNLIMYEELMLMLKAVNTTCLQHQHEVKLNFSSSCVIRLCHLLTCHVITSVSENTNASITPQRFVELANLSSRNHIWVLHQELDRTLYLMHLELRLNSRHRIVCFC